MIKGQNSNERYSKIVADVESTLAPYFKEIEEIAYINQRKVLNAFHHVKAT